ncbi:MAG: hypothetical protein A3I66_12515 [Burkholderiales bacterium RIFCSPLOWO2_02_FULL_57_36]|nr:MAG: hypothetical protein A3I66_12515 [Burkholderiales bacterium RIFCSPLOWO2_02_FULL_57_36]
MPTEQIGQYEIEYSGVQLADGKEWTAHVAIFGPSHNPMHRNSIFPEQRISVEHTYPSQQEAEAEGRRFAMEKVEEHGR